MAINFPTGPTVNDLYVYGGVTYQWNGVFWIPYSVASDHGFFHVDRNNVNQTGLTTGALNKLQFTNEVADINSYFDSATNYRYTPLVAGRYVFIVATSVNSTADVETGTAYIQKNSSALLSYAAGYFYGPSGFVGASAAVMAVVSLNGSTDYVEGHAYVSANATSIEGSVTTTYMMGWRIGD